MNLKSLSNKELLASTKAAFLRERESTSNFLHHLVEVNRRGIVSLFSYCRELGYSEAEAQLRISAARLMAAVPEVEEKMEQGALSLTTLGRAQTFFNQEKVSSPEVKRELLSQLENKSSREAEKILTGLAPEAPRAEKVRSISSTESELRITVEDALLADLQKAMGLLAHQLPKKPSYRDLLKKMTEIVLAQVDPAQKNPAPQHRAPKVNSKTIPKAIRRQVWKRDESCCAHIDEKSGARCRTHRGLQIHHIIPQAYGGKHTLENLQLLCWDHHRVETEEVFGKSFRTGPLAR